VARVTKGIETAGGEWLIGRGFVITAVNRRNGAREGAWRGRDVRCCRISLRISLKNQDVQGHNHGQQGSRYTGKLPMLYIHRRHAAYTAQDLSI
jgi:hypothetical protein